MSKVYILILMFPIAYLLTLLIEFLSDKLLRSKSKEFAEWEMVYTPPLCPRNYLVPMVYACLIAGCLIPHTLKGQILSCLLLVQLLVVAIIDYQYQFIFDEQNLLLAAIGLLRMSNFQLGWKEAACASVGAFIVMFVIMLLSRGALGGGDVKLMAALGLWLGAWGILQAFMYGIMAGGVGALVLLLLKKKGRRQFFAYGPYLCLGAVYAWWLTRWNW